MNWLKSLFGSWDRQTVAAERAAKALEDMAGDLEGLRDQLRARLGIEAPAPVVVTAIAATAEEPAKAKREKAKG